MFINVFTESGLYQRSRTGIDYPYIFPGKEIEDKIPTVNIDTFTGFDGGPYPSSSQGPIHLFTNTTTYVKNRHTLKGGIAMEYSGEDDFDQINVNAIPGGTNNQNGQFEFRNSSSARSGIGISDMALGLFTNYAEIGQRAFTRWRALATDLFVQDSWRPSNNLTIEGGVRYVFWPPWYSTTNNIANFEPRSTTRRTRPSSTRRPGVSSRVRVTTVSCCQPTASRATGTIWSLPRIHRSRRCSRGSRAASRRRTTTCSSRASGHHTR